MLCDPADDSLIRESISDPDEPDWIVRATVPCLTDKGGKSLYNFFQKHLGYSLNGKVTRVPFVRLFIVLGGGYRRRWYMKGYTAWLHSVDAG